MNRPAAFIFRLALVIFCASSFAIGQAPSETAIIDATEQSKVVPSPLSQFGGESPTGHRLAVNSDYLMLDGKPWLPVMGEFHYSRYPEQYWEEELLKMKAGGVQIVATYVFWIHHEEVQGQFDWSGRRDLRQFVELCHKHGLYVFLRVGPYAHGEVRHGGLPDWVLDAGPTRTNDPRYLASVRTYYRQVSDQVRGLFWKDGGPIIGLQLENEYSKRGPGAGAEHILQLKQLAREAGLDAPLYTVTGWDNAAYPAGEFIPVFGGYVDNFWESRLDDLPPAGYYLFTDAHPNNRETAGQNAANVQYPLFLAEAGGGMQVAYHRRPLIDDDDVAAMTLAELGSGVNLYGYYMFQGGANPEGKLTTLQESVATDGVYDLPQISYDFQAPLGEFGDMHASFRRTKVLHLFLHEFGNQLAPMCTLLPRTIPNGPGDRSTLRVAARMQGNRGFIFLNNYQRLYPLANHHAVQIRISLPNETLVFPRKPISIFSGAYFIWPINLEIGGALLKYATAEPLARISNSDDTYEIFFAQPGIDPEFSFDESTLDSIAASQATVSRAGGRVLVEGVVPSTSTAIQIRAKDGKTTHIVVLTHEEALNAWKLKIGGQDRLVISPADVFADENRLYLHARAVEDLQFAIFPAPTRMLIANSPIKRNEQDGIFATYSAAMRPKHIRIEWHKLRDAAPSKPVRVDQYNAMAPANTDFDRAASWQISVPARALDGVSDIFVKVDYLGDVAHLNQGQRLFADDFYKGTPWEFGLKRYLRGTSAVKMVLRVMPLRADAPIYISSDSWRTFQRGNEVADVRKIELFPEYELRIDFGVRTWPSVPGDQGADSQRKAPVPVNQAPQKRKSTAHRASGG